jgi:PST family polysaccharide transporter
VAVPVVLAGVLGGLPWGIRGVAAGYAVGSFSLFYYSVRQAFLLVDLDVRLFWRVLIRPLLASVGMVALIAGADSVLAATMPAVRLGSGVSVGLLVYVTLSILVNREQVADLVARIRMAVAKTTA